MYTSHGQMKEKNLTGLTFSRQLSYFLQAL